MMGQVQKVTKAENSGCLAEDKYRVGPRPQGDLLPPSLHMTGHTVWTPAFPALEIISNLSCISAPAQKSNKTSHS